MKTILQKMKELKDDDLSEDEAIRSAISYRKHSINKLIPDL